MLDNLLNLQTTLEEELNYRNQKKFYNDNVNEKLRTKGEIKYPINIGTIEGEPKYGQKGTK
jgi:hypothetical protein